MRGMHRLGGGRTPWSPGAPCERRHQRRRPSDDASAPARHGRLREAARRSARKNRTGVDPRKHVCVSRRASAGALLSAAALGSPTACTCTAASARVARCVQAHTWKTCCRHGFDVRADGFSPMRAHEEAFRDIAQDDHATGKESTKPARTPRSYASSPTPSPELSLGAGQAALLQAGARCVTSQAPTRPVASLKHEVI